MRVHATAKKIGRYASLICAIHCAAMPVLMLILPVVKYLEALEYPLLATAIVFTGLVAAEDYKAHRDLIGFGFVSMSVLFFAFGVWTGLHATTFVGAVLLSIVQGRHLLKYHNHKHC